MQTPSAQFLPAASLSHGHSPFNARHDSYATESSMKIIINFGLRGDGQVDAVERFRRPYWARYCNLQRMPTPVEANKDG
jgi:hypothetical protein